MSSWKKACNFCGFDEKMRGKKPRTMLDKVAYALHKEHNRGIAPCCQDYEDNCECWTGRRSEARVAILAIRAMDRAKK